MVNRGKTKPENSSPVTVNRQHNDLQFTIYH
jgi:hypothetical protein